MIDVVQEVFELTIEHALNVDEFDLSTYTKSFRDNVPDLGHWLPPAQNLLTRFCQKDRCIVPLAIPILEVRAELEHVTTSISV